MTSGSPMNSASTSRRRVVLGMAAGAVAATGLAAASMLPPPRPKQRVEVGEAVLPEFAAQAESVALAMVTTTDEFYHLVKDPDGWVLPEKGRYPVRPDRVAALIEGLASMRYARPMTRDERKFDRIGLGDPAQGGAGALLEVGDGRGGSFAKLVVGYRNGTTYVRTPDDLQAWAVDFGAAEDRALPPMHRGALWLDLNVVDVGAADIAEVQVRVGLSAYGLAPSDDQGSAFALAPPHAGRLAPGFALTLIAQALTRFAPTDVAPATDIPIDAVSAVHVTQLKSGALVAVRAFRSKGRPWITLNAVAEGDATADARIFAQAVNSRAGGWAFGLSETDWGAYATPLEALALR